MTQPSTAPAAAAAHAALSDQEVVARVLAGEPELYEIVMRRHNQRLFRVARAVLRDDAEAEDVLQETYVRAYRQLAGFRGESALSTWLTRIALHEALARARKARRFVAVGEGKVEELPQAAALRAQRPDRAAEARELGEHLREALESLPEPLRVVFVLREVEGLSTAEAAAALGLSPENVKVRLHRARAALRAGLDARLGREARRLYLFAGSRCDRLVAAVFARLAGD